MNTWSSSGIWLAPYFSYSVPHYQLTPVLNSPSSGGTSPQESHSGWNKWNLDGVSCHYLNQANHLFAYSGNQQEH